MTKDKELTELMDELPADDEAPPMIDYHVWEIGRNGAPFKRRGTVPLPDGTTLAPINAATGCAEFLAVELANRLESDQQAFVRFTGETVAKLKTWLTQRDDRLTAPYVTKTGGMVLVPAEETDAMVMAACEEMARIDRDEPLTRGSAAQHGLTYRAMIAEALAAQATAEGDSELPRMLREIGFWDHRGDSVAEACDERYGAGSWDAMVAAIDQPNVQPKGTALGDIAARICRDVAELPDRDSPPDWPEAMLVTQAELLGIVRTALDEVQAPAPAPREPAAEELAELVRNCKDAADEMAIAHGVFRIGGHMGHVQNEELARLCDESNRKRAALHAEIDALAAAVPCAAVVPDNTAIMRQALEVLEGEQRIIPSVKFAPVIDGLRAALSQPPVQRTGPAEAAAALASRFGFSVESAAQAIKTLAGIKAVIDPAMPPGVAVFRDDRGRVVGRIFDERTKACEDCGGYGSNNSNEANCASCKGTGRVSA